MLQDGSKLHKQNLSRTATKSVLLAILYLALWRATLKPGNRKPESGNWKPESRKQNPESTNQRKQFSFSIRKNYFA